MTTQLLFVIFRFHPFVPLIKLFDPLSTIITTTLYLTKTHIKLLSRLTQETTSKYNADFVPFYWKSQNWLRGPPRRGRTLYLFWTLYLLPKPVFSPSQSLYDSNPTYNLDTHFYGLKYHDFKFRHQVRPLSLNLDRSQCTRFRCCDLLYGIL